MKNKDLIWIKKHYGENMMKMCRLYFASILEEEGALISILEENFYEYKYLAEDILLQNQEKNFEKFIFSKFQKETIKQVLTNKTPFELLDEAGYILYECKNEDDILNFINCYDKSELLCTFNGDRLNRCDVFFVLKKNWKEIKRKTEPRREDDYGISVLSIQFNKGNINNVSIKNRYNHSVNNPDATFSNNLENIIAGLTNSFENEYGYKILNSNEEVDFELVNYFKADDNRYYKYTNEINNVYYCIDNIVINGMNIIKYNKEKYILMESYLFDIENKIIKDLARFDNSFNKSLGKMTKITISKKEKTKEVIINTANFTDESILVLNKDNEIIKITLPNTFNLGNNFLIMNEKLKEANLENIDKIGDWVFANNKELEKITLPKVKTIGNKFLDSNNKIQNINLESIKELGNDFMSKNEVLESINIENIEQLGADFLKSNKNINKLDLFNIVYKNETKKLGKTK